MSEDIIVNNVSFAYDEERVLKDVDFSFSKKDFLAIIGPNGGGKSTLLKLMIGMLQPDVGTISIFGKNVSEVSKKIGYVPQNTMINKGFPIKVIDVVLMGRLSNTKKFGSYTKKDMQIAMESLTAVGMSKYADKKIGNLSGGQRQRAFIARALATEAEILFLDEPTASIDTQGQIKIYETLKQINKDKGIVVISHDVNILLGYANKIAHVNKTLYMHNAPEITREMILENIDDKTGHICPVELLMSGKHKGIFDTSKVARND